MTPKEFKTRWESDENGGEITFEDVAECAKSWGLYSTPKIHPINEVLDSVLEMAGISTDSKGNTV